MEPGVTVLMSDHNITAVDDILNQTVVDVCNVGGLTYFYLGENRVCVCEVFEDQLTIKDTDHINLFAATQFKLIERSLASKLRHDADLKYLQAAKLEQIDSIVNTMIENSITIEEVAARLAAYAPNYNPDTEG